MSVESSDGEGTERRILAQQHFLDNADTSAPAPSHAPAPSPAPAPAPAPATNTYLEAFLQRDSGQPVVEHTPNTLSHSDAILQSLTATTPLTKTASGRSGSIVTRDQQSASTYPTSILSSSLLDRKSVEQKEVQLQERPLSRTSVRATNGSDTGSSSESSKTGRKKEQVEFELNSIGIGSQFCGQAKAKTKNRGVVLHHYLEGNVDVPLALAVIESKITDIESKRIKFQSRMESRMESQTRHQYLHTFLLTAILITCGIIVWKI